MFKELGIDAGLKLLWDRDNISDINSRVRDKLEALHRFDSEIRLEGDFCILDMVSAGADTKTAVYRLGKRYISTAKTTFIYKLNWFYLIWNRSPIPETFRDKTASSWQRIMFV